MAAFGGAEEVLPSVIVVVHSAKGLRNADWVGESDPYCTLSCSSFSSSTAVVPNNLNPVWDQAFLVCLAPESPPTVKLSVFDSDAGMIMDGTDDFLGSVEFNLHDVLPPSGWNQFELPLTGDAKAQGGILVSVLRFMEATVTIDRCNGLRNADGIWGKSDPYGIVIGGGVIWGKTRVIKNDLNPVFEEHFEVNLLDRFPMGGKLDPFRIKFMDADEGILDSTDDPLGDAVLNWSQLFPEGGQCTHTIPLSGKKAKGTAVLSVATKPPTNPANGAATKLPMASVLAVLEKGLGMKISDCAAEGEVTFNLGLAWDVTNGVSIDLDASCIALDSEFQKVDIIYFGSKTSNAAGEGAVVHGGDNTSGSKDGDDETITVDVSKLSPSVQYMGFVINSFSGQKLNEVHRAGCRLYESSDHRVLTSYDMTSDERLDCTAFFMCLMYKRDGEWFIHAVGEPASGKVARDNVNDLQAYLSKNPLAVSETPVLPTQTKVIKAPAVIRPDRKISLPLPNGGREEIVLPEGVGPNDLIEVPVLMMVS